MPTYRLKVDPETGCCVPDYDNPVLEEGEAAPPPPKKEKKAAKSKKNLLKATKAADAVGGSTGKKLRGVQEQPREVDLSLEPQRLADEMLVRVHERSGHYDLFKFSISRHRLPPARGLHSTEVTERIPGPRVRCAVAGNS